LQHKIAFLTNHALSMKQILDKIVILIFEIINSSNHDTKIVCSILNHDSRIDTIANQIVFAIVNTKSQSTQIKILVRTIFVWWIKFHRHVNQIIKHSSYTLHHYRSINKMNELFTQKNYQFWISFIKTKKNSKIQRIILILNWRSISINANLLICQSTRTKKTSR
jgi:hypothetical protein